MIKFIFPFYHSFIFNGETIVIPAGEYETDNKAYIKYFTTLKFVEFDKKTVDSLLNETKIEVKTETKSKKK